MKVQIAFDVEKTRALSFQLDFPAETKCYKCKGQARLAFVAHELHHKAGTKALCHLYPNKGKGGYWLHDLCAVAVYFCKKCFQPIAIYNQG